MPKNPATSQTGSVTTGSPWAALASCRHYYGRFVQIHGLRDDPKPFVRGYFNTIPYALNRENLSFWEHSPNKGAWNKTHETGYFLQQTRMMMVMERGSELWLAPFVTHHWMKDGMTVSLRNAPTSFGKVSYRIVSAVGRGTIEAEINPPQRSDPSLIVLRLRHPNEKRMRSVRINGRMHTDFDPQREIIRIKPGGREIRVLATY